jgi:hypothetical protein
MTIEEYTNHYTTRLLESYNPEEEATQILHELNELVDDEDVAITETQKDKIIYEVKYMVNDEMTRASDDAKELDEEAIINALDILDTEEE